MFGLLWSAGARPDPDRSTATGRRHLQGACRDQHGHRHGRYRARGRGHGRTASRRGLSRGGCPSDHVRTAKGQSGGAAAGDGGAQADPSARASRRGGCETRGLVGRPVQADREGRLFLRTRYGRRQVHGGGLRCEPHPLRARGYRPDRDIILALDTDEEILDRDALGIQWLLKNHRDLIDAEFALNEGGSVGLKNGKPIRNSVQTSEKVSLSYQLEVKNRGGHSSLPSKDNAIYRLAEGLARLSKFTFPFKLDETTRAYFERTAELEGEQVAADIRSVISGRPDPASLSLMRLSANPVYNAQLRTTCVATMLEGGHAYNALPQVARATVNCRIMPGEPVDDVKATLVWVLADDQIAVTQMGEPILSAPSALHGEIMGVVAKLSAEFWPGAPIVPTMSAGATDGSYLRNAGIPTYGHSGLAGDVDDVRVHGRDERVLLKVVLRRPGISVSAGQEVVGR